jgi:FkbM family methyltransferase
MVATQTAVFRASAAILGAVGLRDRAFTWRQAQTRRRRRAEEQAGSDHLSRPAAFGMDRKLNEIIDRDGGFFIEAGANDGFIQSNTYWLERFRGWTGLLVEPMSELAAEARLNRPEATVVESALVPFDHPDETIRMTFGDLMTHVAGIRQNDGWAATGLQHGWRDPYEADVPARPLSDVLDEIGAPEIDLFSLDVEGFEPGVLRGLDLDRHAPRFLLIEMHDRDEMKAEIEAILGDRYAFSDWLSPVDGLYRRREPSSR